MNNTTPSGFLLLNKPKNVSSFYCVNQIKRLVGKKVKVGHSGTLDTFATGLLIICVGRAATKQVPSLMGLDKTYVVRAKLGEITDTLDYTGTIVEQCDAAHVTQKALINAIKALGSSYEQVPPIYSALKHKGKPLYALARKEKLSEEELVAIAEAKKRRVQLYEVSLDTYSPPFFMFTARVSKGTYIRSLANDIAQKAGSIATCYELKRTAIGPLNLENAVSLDALTSLDVLQAHLLSWENVGI